MHGPDMESLHRFIPKSFLPEEVGGDGSPFDWDGFEEFLCKVPVDRPCIPEHVIQSESPVNVTDYGE